MSLGATHPRSPAPAAPLRKWILSLAALVSGGIALIIPFIPGGQSWSWQIRSAADLEGADVNAVLVSVGASGARLTPQPGRAISLITPPLQLSRNVERTLRIDVSCLQVTTEVVGPSRVRLLWQTEPGEAYEFQESRVRLSGGPVAIEFSIPESPDRLHRLGVQFPDAQGPIDIRSLTIPVLSIPERARLFARQLSEREPLMNHALNFLRGPNMLGRTLNLWLVALGLTVGGAVALARIRSGRPVTFRSMAAVGLLVWLLGDGQAAANLDRNLILETKRFYGRSALEKIELAEGPEIAWAWQQLVEHCPEGESYAVISDDPFTPGHRLDYYLAPNRVQCAASDAPPVIVVIRSASVRIDAERSSLVVPLHSGGAVEWPGSVVAARDDSVFLFKRAAGPIGSPLEDDDVERERAAPPRREPAGGKSRLLWIVLAIFSPWCVGTILLPMIRNRPVRPFMDLTLGLLVGQSLTMCLLYLSFRFTGASQARTITVALAITATTLWVSYFTLRAGARRGEFPYALPRQAPRAAPLVRALLILIAVSLGTRFLFMLADVANVPIRGDDAISIWLYRARCIAATDQLSFDRASAHYLGGSIPGYPVFLSLIAAWIPLVVGGWSEPLAVLWWPLWYFILVLTVGLGLRKWLPAFEATLAAWIVASLPLLCVHVCRPGYADLPLAVFLTAAVLCGLQWRASARLADLLTFLIFLTAAACLKREGPFLALIVAAALVAAGIQPIRAMRVRSRILGAAALLAAVVWCFAVLDFSEQRDALAGIGWYPAAFLPLVRHAFAWSSFNVLFWLCGVLLACIAVHRGAQERRVTLLLSLGLLGFVAAVFLVTPQVRFALNNQTPSRLLLQVAPAIILLLARSVAPLLATSPTNSTPARVP